MGIEDFKRTKRRNLPPYLGPAPLAERGLADVRASIHSQIVDFIDEMTAEAIDNGIPEVVSVTVTTIIEALVGCLAEISLRHLDEVQHQAMVERVEAMLAKARELCRTPAAMQRIRYLHMLVDEEPQGHG